MTAVSTARSNRVRVAVVLCLAFATNAAAWSARTAAQLGKRGAALAPPDLARQIDRHERSFYDGIKAARSVDPRRAESEALLQADAIRRKVDQHVPFEEVVFDLGYLAQLVMSAGDPIVHSRDVRVKSYGTDYQGYAELLYPRLPKIYYGIHPRALSGSGVAEVLRTARSRAERLSGYVGQEYYRNGILRSSSSFDDHAVTFGVASICLSRSVSDIASIFTAVWSQVAGDTRPLETAAKTDRWRPAG